jgi:hypothetical protein
MLWMVYKVWWDGMGKRALRGREEGRGKRCMYVCSMAGWMAGWVGGWLFNAIRCVECIDAHKKKNA